MMIPGRTASLYAALAITAFIRSVYPGDFVLSAIKALTPYRRQVVVSVQMLIFALAGYCSFLIRFDGVIPPLYLNIFLIYLPVLVLVRTVFLYAFSLEKGLWRYVSSRDVISITLATSAGSLLFLLLMRFWFREVSYPRSVYFIDWFLNIFLLGGARLFRRLHEMSGNPGGDRKKVLIIGAGASAEMLIRDIERSPSYPYHITGLVDDDPRKKGLMIRNVPILGTRKDIKDIVSKNHPDELLIAAPTVPDSELQAIIKDLKQFGLPIKTLPGLWNILSGRDSMDRMAVVGSEDVLFRAPVDDSCRGLKDFFSGRRVMITGAGGSIGSELSRQVASFDPSCLVLFERHEENLYEIDMELKSENRGDCPMVRQAHHDICHPEPAEGGTVPAERAPEIISVIGDILDGKRVSAVMEKYRPEIVLHAAAYKHVPLMEDNPHEAVKTNIIGTKTVAEKARACGVERFILISTDKAVNPSNVMGMTKKIAEEIVRSLSASSGATKYITVRFGNVLESSGSVVPLFREQIRRGGPVTVTHPDITRYFMTIPEAVSLVLQAATMGNGGEVFVLDMGSPVRIVDLAKKMITLYGYKPGVDMEINFIGLRPGEKLYEELFNADEKTGKTSHPKINMARSEKDAAKMPPDFADPSFWEGTQDIKAALNKIMQ